MSRSRLIRKMRAACLGALGLLLFSSEAAFSQSGPAANLPATARLAESVNGFGFQLLKAMSQDPVTTAGGPSNCFVSPASIAWAFDLVLNGSGGATYEAIAKTLQLTGWSATELNATNLALRKELETADPQVQISVANSLWGKSGLEFLPEFLQAAKQFYAAELAPLTGAGPINAWVSAATKGKITSIIKDSDVTPQTTLFIVNALYFKGLWQKPFDKAKTTSQAFHGMGAADHPVPTMDQSGSYLYYEDPQLQAIRLPYGSSRMALIVVLPATNSSLKAFTNSLDVAHWKGIVSQMKKRSGEILLPRFKVEFGAELNQILRKMGMDLAFTDQADFKKLAKVPPDWWVKISSVKHKTFVEVNEEGTEAAAVTSISMLAGAAYHPPEAPFRMQVDRPFFAALQDNSTGLILFLGSVAAP